MELFENADVNTAELVQAQVMRACSSVYLRVSGEAAFQCGRWNNLKRYCVDRKHFIRFRSENAVFKFIRLSVDEA